MGTHSITAVYSGDSNFTGITSNTLSQVVTKATNPPLNALVHGTEVLSQDNETMSAAWYKRLRAPMKHSSRPKTPPGRQILGKIGLKAPRLELRQKGIHVISDAIAKLMADNPNTI